MALIELEDFQGPQFLGFVRNLPTPAPFKAEQWLPDKTVLDLSVEYIVGVEDKPVMASIMAWDAEAPIGARPGLGFSLKHDLPPIKRKMKIPEKELIRFLTPRANTSDKQDVIDFVYRDTARLVDGVKARVEWMRMQALSEDTLAYAEEGVTVTVDYGIGADQQYDVGTNVNLTTYWETIATADWVADLMYICDTEETRTGFRPRTLIVPKATTRYMMQNAAAKVYLWGATVLGRQLTWAEVQSLLSVYDLPEVVTYDAIVYEEQSAGNVTALRPLDLKKGVLLPGPEATIGNTLWGPTAESRPLIGTNQTSQAPGIYVVAYGDFDPPAEWVKVAAVALPSMPGANLIGQLQLLTP